ADAAAPPPVHAAPTGAELGPLPRTRRGVRAEGLPARRGARRVAVLHLPDRRSEARTTMNGIYGSTSGFLFRVWPYLALVLAVAGFAARLLLTGDRLPALRRALPRVRQMFVGGRAWVAAW